MPNHLPPVPPSSPRRVPVEQRVNGDASEFHPSACSTALAAGPASKDDFSRALLLSTALDGAVLARDFFRAGQIADGLVLLNNAIAALRECAPQPIEVVL